MGQLGIGKHREVRTPQLIRIFDDETNQEQRVQSCAAGYGHTACLTENGDIYTWGFNIYGQLGLGDKSTRWTPQRVKHDISYHMM
jgi:alpha-tubulin suppressor-like RCC1 family protein